MKEDGLYAVSPESYKLPVIDTQESRRNFPGFETYQFVTVDELIELGEAGNTGEDEEGDARKKGKETKR